VGDNQCTYRGQRNCCTDGLGDQKYQCTDRIQRNCCTDDRNPSANYSGSEQRAHGHPDESSDKRANHRLSD
jgi:hypothetical protein